MIEGRIDDGTEGGLEKRLGSYFEMMIRLEDVIEKVDVPF